jgi:uncharacterized protein (UPF0332 family)
MNFQDILALAEELALDGRAAHCRSAISRAYYAAYHGSVAFLFHVGVRAPSDALGHLAVSNALIGVDEVDELVRDLGGELMALHRERNIADYRMSSSRVEKQDEALNWVDVAKRILAEMDACRDDDDRSDELWQHYRAWVPSSGQSLRLTLV